MKEIEITSLSAIEHLLSHKPERVRRLFLYGGSPRVKELEYLARRAGVAVDTGGSRGKEKNFEPVRAYIAPFQYTEMAELLEGVSQKNRAIVIALDHLQDPQNFGAICRTAEALGVSGVLLPRDRSVVVTPGVYSASVGAVETVPVVQVSNVGEGLRKLKEAGFWIVGTTLNEGATGIEAMPDFDKVVLVLGAELEGLSPGIEKLCDWRIYIPLIGKVQSLNVSAAGAILMHELMKSRQDSGAP